MSFLDGVKAGVRDFLGGYFLESQLQPVTPSEERGPAEYAHVKSAFKGVMENAAYDTKILLSPSTGEAEIAAYAYSHNPIVSGLIGIACEGIQNIKFKVVRQDPDTLEITSAKGTLLYGMLQRGGLNQSMRELMAHCYMWYALTGNCYVAALPSTNSNESEEELLYLTPLNPRFLWPVIDEKVGISEWIYSPVTAGTPPNLQDINSENTVRIPRKLMMHMQNPNPNSAFLGSGPMEALRNDYDIFEFTQKAIQSRMEHTIKIQAAIELLDENITDVQRQGFESRMRANAANPRFSGTLILEPGMKYTPVPSPQMDHLVQQVLVASYRHMALSFRVPLELFSSGEGVRDRIDLERAMWTYNITPFAYRFCEALKRAFGYQRTSKDVVVIPDFSEVPVYQALKLDQMRRVVAGAQAGVFTPNESRGILGMPSYPEDIYGDFGDTPLPVFHAQIAEASAKMKASESLSLPGSEGGRDQSETGEAKMLDSSGKK